LEKGYDIENTYRINHKDITENEKEEFRIFYDKVRLFPCVEKAFLTGRYTGTTPFGNSYSGIQISKDTVASAESVQVQQKPVTSNNYFEIFKVRSVLHPGTFGKLDIANPKSIVLTADVARVLFGNESALGRSVFMDGSEEYTVTDVVERQKPYNYEKHCSSVFFNAKESDVKEPEIAIRVGKDFSLDRFKKEVTSSIVTYKEVGKRMDIIMGMSNEIRIRFGLMAFFLLNIALGVIGTLWFRVTSRRNEIGVRMAMGSNRRRLRLQFIGEALALLTLVFVPAVCINFAVVQAGLINAFDDYFYSSNNKYIIDNVWLRFFLTTLITYLFLAVIVTVSAWIPARQASKMHPVEALRDE
jgi:putative ABC transport system permease protein